MYPISTPHLNPFGCEIRSTEGKGRAVFATQHIPKQTTIDISPVLFFNPDEYESYAKHTIIDHYALKWRDGRMALALGLGSIFNHSFYPNVSYVLDNDHACIKYTTMRPVAPGDELSIFYGNKLWFQDYGSATSELPDEVGVQEDAWDNLRIVDLSTEDEEASKLLMESELPFEKVTVPSEGEEEGCLDSKIQTMNAWAIEISEPRKTAEMIKWLKETGLEHPSLKHAKHIRKWMDPDTGASRTALLLTPVDEPPSSILYGLTPYVVEIPRFPARTLEQVKAKSAIWPVFYEAQNHKELRDEAQRWTHATVNWFCEAVNILKKEAKRVKSLGEFPIVSYVPTPVNAPLGVRSYIAHDTRVSSQHPLRHSIFNLVRLMGDTAESEDSSQNGQNYLLTSLTLFTTHEPCIACSMALVHSRVKEMVYLYPMPQTGGCGGLACVSGLKNVNHRYKIWKWRRIPMGAGGVEADVDA